MPSQTWPPALYVSITLLDYSCMSFSSWFLSCFPTSGDSSSECGHLFCAPCLCEHFKASLGRELEATNLFFPYPTGQLHQYACPLCRSSITKPPAKVTQLTALLNALPASKQEPLEGGAEYFVGLFLDAWFLTMYPMNFITLNFQILILYVLIPHLFAMETEIKCLKLCQNMLLWGVESV